MVDIEYLLGFYPPHIAQNVNMHKHILKEYVELLSLDYLTRTPTAERLIFIGGTNLRLIQSINRFSEDLDFDCKELPESEFLEMTDGLICHLRQCGLQAEPRDKVNNKLTAYRRSIYFPELLFELGLSGHHEERFLLKVEAQDQGINYTKETAMVNRCGFLFPVQVPSNSILLSMKLSALLSRAKGRDFYDTLFLWQKTEPDLAFLKLRCGIGSRGELYTALMERIAATDLKVKQRDFEHLLFTPSDSARILFFPEFVKDKLAK